MPAKLGQHFLTSSDIAAKIAAAGNAAVGDTVLEVGPGKGILTEQLLKTGAQVVAVEKDSELVPLLHERFPKEIASGQLRIVEGDILKETPESLDFSGKPYKIIANIPYYLTGHFIRTWLEAEHQPSSMTLLVQREVAERVVAKDSFESTLSISVKCYGMPSMKGIVRAGSFSPPPKVDSAILHIADISRDFFANISEQRFFAILKAGFSHPRKMLAGNLRAMASGERISEAFSAIGIDSGARAETVSIGQWQALTKELE